MVQDATHIRQVTPVRHNPCLCSVGYGPPGGVIHVRHGGYLHLADDVKPAVLPCLPLCAAGAEAPCDPKDRMVMMMTMMMTMGKLTGVPFCFAQATSHLPLQYSIYMYFFKWQNTHFFSPTGREAGMASHWISTVHSSFSHTISCHQAGSVEYTSLMRWRSLIWA